MDKHKRVAVAILLVHGIQERANFNMADGELKNAIFGDGEGVVFINKFYATDVADQEWLVQELAHITEAVIRHQLGFISANVHKGFDDFTVTNYARWRSAEDFKAALQTPEMLAHRKVLGDRYKREGSLGRIVYTYIAQSEDVPSCS